MEKTTKTNDEVRLDICAWGSWLRDQKAFYNASVFDPNATKYSKQTLKQGYCLEKYERKRYCNTRKMEVDQGSFTKLVFTVAGGMGGEGTAFYSLLSILVSLKKGIDKSKVAS